MFEGIAVEDATRGVTIYDEVCEERARATLQKYPPGNYLFTDLTPERVVERYFKMDRERWLSTFTHDYVTACLRRDDEAKSKLKKAYERLANALGWEDSSLFERFEGDLKAAAEESLRSLFELYKAELRVEGWREKPEQSLTEGRWLLNEPSLAGDLYRTEYGSWRELMEALFTFSADVRLKDRVAYWMGMRLTEEASKNLYGGGDALTCADYLDEVLEGVISGKHVDYYEDTSMWWACVASKALKDHMTAGTVGWMEAGEPITFACMALEGVEPDVRKVGEYLVDLTARLKLKSLKGAPHLLRLYRRARYGPRDKGDIMEGAFFKEWGEMADEEKSCRKQQATAELTFVSYMSSIIQLLRERSGYRRSMLLDNLKERAAEYAAKVQATL